MSVSDHARGSGPKTHSAPIAVPGQRHPEVGADLPRGDRRQVAHPLVGPRVSNDQCAGARGGHRAQRVLQRALRPDRARGQAGAGGDELHVGEHRDLAGRRAEKPGRELGEAVEGEGAGPARPQPAGVVQPVRVAAQLHGRALAEMSGSDDRPDCRVVHRSPSARFDRELRRLTA
jgi:hypothetical protein